MGLKLELPRLRRRAQEETGKVAPAADEASKRLSSIELPSIDVSGAMESARRALGDARRTISETGDRVAVRAEHAASRAGELGTGVRRQVDDLRSVEVRRRRRDPWPGIALLSGIAAGVAAMFLLDPQDGARRRALVRDKLGKWSRIAAREVRGKAVDLRNRGQGMIHEARSAVGLGQQEQAETGTAATTADETSTTGAYEPVGVPVGGGTEETGAGVYGDIPHEPGRPNGTGA